MSSVRIRKKLFVIAVSFVPFFLNLSYLNFWPLTLFATILSLCLLGLALVNFVVDKSSLNFLEYMLLMFGFGTFQAILFFTTINVISLEINKNIFWAFVTVYLTSSLFLSKRDLPSITFEKKHLLILIPIAFYFINAIPDALNHTSLPYRDSYDLTYLVTFVAKYHKTLQAYTNEHTVYLHGFDLFLGFISNASGLDPITLIKWFAVFFAPLTQIAIYVFCYKITNRISIAVGASLCLSSPYFFNWLFLRRSITRPENIGLFLFALILVWLTYRTETKSSVFRLVLALLFSAIFAVHMLSALYLLILTAFIFLYDLGVRKTGVIMFAALAVFLLYFNILDWNIFSFLQGITYPSSSFNFLADYLQNNIIILQLGVIYALYMLHRRKFYSNLHTFSVFGTSLVMIALYYLLPYAFQAIGQEIPFILYRMKSYIELLVVVISSVGLNAVLNYCRRYETLVCIHTNIPLNNQKIFRRISIHTFISITWLAFLLLVPAFHLPAKYIDYNAVSNEDFQTLQLLREYSSDNGINGNFSVIMVGNKELVNYFTSYEYFVDSLFGSRRLYRKSNDYVWDMYLRDPPYLSIALNQTTIMTKILSSEHLMFFVISDRISPNFAENAQGIFEIVNAKNIFNSTLYLFGDEEQYFLQQEIWSHDVLSSDLWKTWKVVKTSNTENTNVLIQVENDQPYGTFSVYAFEEWSLDTQTYPIIEFQIKSLSSDSYQIFAKNAQGDKYILYDGYDTGRIYCNAFTASKGDVLNELHITIRGNGTVLELNQIGFYSFR